VVEDLMGNWLPVFIWRKHPLSRSSSSYKQIATEFADFELKAAITEDINVMNEIFV